MKAVRLSFVILTASLLLASCASGPSGIPQSQSLERDRYMVDPRLGFEGRLTTIQQKRFEHALSLVEQGRLEDASHTFTDIITKQPDYSPAMLALARISYDRSEYDRALQLVERAERTAPFTAAEIYRAEIAIVQGDRAKAYEIYKQLSTAPVAPPTAIERVDELKKEVFEDFLVRAQREDAEASINTLHAALAIQESEPARLLLARRLVELQRFEEARRELDPILARSSDRDEVQELLADIEVSRGDYQSAIARYERLARKRPEAAFREKLANAKEKWTAANMPPQYRKAIESFAINRADLAVLIYWKLSAVRFGSVGQPPIAVDIGSVPGREELVRSLALGIFTVDPVTRTVDPGRTVSTGAFIRIASKLLSLRGVPQCAASVPEGEGHSAASLAACGVDLAPLQESDTVTGHAAGVILDRIEKVLSPK